MSDVVVAGGGRLVRRDVVQAALCGAKVLPLHDRKSPPNPLVNPYQTSDGGWLILMVQNHDWPSLSMAISHPELSIDCAFTDGEKRAANSRN